MMMPVPRAAAGGSAALAQRSMRAGSGIGPREWLRLCPGLGLGLGRRVAVRLKSLASGEPSSNRASFSSTGSHAIGSRHVRFVTPRRSGSD